MLDRFGKQPWFGVLETSSGKTPVAFDPKLPDAQTGQVYLFNLDRGDFVTYDWSIVSLRLRDVPDDEVASLRAQITASWGASRKRLVAQRGRRESPPRSTMGAAVDTNWQKEDATWDDSMLEDMAFE